MGRRILAITVLFLVAGATVGGWTVTGGDVGPDPQTPPDSRSDPAGDERSVEGSPPSADNTLTRIEVYRNGSARWTVRVRTRLDDERRVEEFEAFQSEVREDPESFLGPFRTRITRVVSNAGNATGREMQADSFAISTRIQEVPRRWGVVTYRFRWTNFASESGDRVVVGDVVQGGFYLATNDTFEVAPPEGYAATDVDPAPDARDGDELAWNGERDFADARPRVALEPVATTTAGDDDQTGNEDGGQADSDDGTDDDGRTGSDGGDRSLLEIARPVAMGALGAIGVLVVVGVLGYVAMGRSSGVEPVEEGDDAGTETGADRETDDADGDDGHGDGGGRTILTDENRVMDLLESRDGQMHQSDVAEELEWSSSKTSRVLSEMTEEGAIEKIRIGRQNVIRFPEDEDDDTPDRDWSDV